MNPELERAKARYQDVQPPEALDFAVASAIREGDRRRRRKKAARRAWGTGLAACACFVLLLNTSQPFAGAVAQVPLLGELAKIFTVTQYSVTDREHLIDVRLPALENTGHTDLEQRINTEIQTRIQALIDAAEDRAQEARDAYIATGGQEENFIPIIIDVDYEVTCQNDQYLSFVVTESETLASAYQQFYTYSIDLKTGKELTLQDLLGPDYVEIANAAIHAEIAQRSQEDGNVYFDGTNGVEGFQTIRPDQPFYLNGEGVPVVIFEKYEIAPGYMGVQKFSIR